MDTLFKHCSVEGCNRNAHYTAGGSKGMCCAHYQRMKNHGNVYSCGVLRGEPVEWLRRHAAYTGNGCLIWPFSKKINGYGQVRYEGRAHNASRVMCMFAHGVAPSPIHEAAHSCGNGHKGCVNPSHIRWDTPKGNCSDRAKHGTENRGVRQWCNVLTDNMVREIRALKGKMLQREIAEKYGVSRMTINNIFNHRTWSWLK